VIRNSSADPALSWCVMVAGIRFDDREPGVPIPQPRPERIASLEFFLTHDAPAVRRPATRDPRRPQLS